MATTLSQLYIDYAKETKKKYPAVMVSVMLAQFIIESSAGTSHRARVSNNCFGMGGGGTAGRYNGMAAYKSKKDSFLAYGREISKTKWTRYTKNASDPRSYLRGLQKVPYCADPAGEAYVNQCMSAISNYGLRKYDSSSSSSTTNRTTGTRSSSTSTVKTQDIVDVAMSQVGYKEGAGNSTKYGAWMGKNGSAWCHMFVSWCAWKAGVGSYIPKTASTDYGMKWFKDRGLFKKKGTYTPKRNDIVYFKTGRSHVGIVRYAKNGTLYTVEGNSSNMVRTRTYSLNNGTITGYGTPKYPSWTKSSEGSTAGSTSSSSSSSRASSDAEKKAQAKQELAYLKKVLSRHSEDKPISGKIVDTNTRPDGANAKLLGYHKKDVYQMAAVDEVKMIEKRSGSPAELEFSAYYGSGKYVLTEGDAVLLKYGRKKRFYGYVFIKSRTKNGLITYICYDQLRYLKNKDTIIFKHKTADQMLRQIAKRFGLKTASKLPNTKYYMTKVEDDSELFDIIDDALEETAVMKDKEYILYDDCGRLTLKALGDMKVNSCVVDADTAEDYTYKSSIDSDVYDQIKLVYENEKTGKYDYYVVRSSKHINQWGLLQYTDKIDWPTVGKEKAKALLELYNQKSRTLSVSGVIGNVLVRGGSLVPVILDLGDIKVANYMVVDKVEHHFKSGYYNMDLDLSGGGFASES